MESNIEARNKTESNYFPGSTNRYSVYPSSNNIAIRQNGSLPRKFTTNTSIPVRTDYYNYSHGKQKKTFKYTEMFHIKYSLKLHILIAYFVCLFCVNISFFYNFINHYNFHAISCGRRFEHSKC